MFIVKKYEFILNETFRNILFTLLPFGSGYFISNAFGILVTINKLNDKHAVLHSCYKDMNHTVEIIEISGR